MDLDVAFETSNNKYHLNIIPWLTNHAPKKYINIEKDCKKRENVLKEIINICKK